MATPNIIIFKYMHGDRLFPKGVLLGLFLGWIVVTALLALFVGAFALILFVIGIWAFLAKGRQRCLSVGPRYLLCGNRIVYYANVRRMELAAGKALTLKLGNGESFTLEMERFPTNANKKEKIQKNKTAKFEKASNKLIRHVLLAAPYVECSGINRARIEQAQG